MTLWGGGGGGGGGQCRWSIVTRENAKEVVKE